MAVSNFALLGLNAEHRIVWHCDNDSGLIPPNTSGMLLQEAFPKIPETLEPDRWTQLSLHSGEAPLSVRSHKVDTAKLTWLLQFDASGSKATTGLSRPSSAHLFQSARRELMTELHHTGQQVLTALLIRLGGMGESGSEDDMREIRSLVVKAQTDMRAMTQTVVPNVLAASGLGAALSQLSQVLAEQGEVSLAVPNDDGQRYSEPVEIAAYELIRGILTRLRNTGLRRASVTLHARDGALRALLELDQIVTEDTLISSAYCQVLLNECDASVRSDVDSNGTTLVLEFPIRSLP